MFNNFAERQKFEARMNTRSTNMSDHKDVADAWKEDFDNGFEISNTMDTPMVGTPLLEAMHNVQYAPLPLDPKNEAALDPETRAIRAEDAARIAHVRNMTHKEAMTTLRFDKTDLQRLGRMTKKWAEGGPPRTYKRKRPRAYKRKTWVRKPRTTRKKKKWVPYKTWLRNKRR